MKTETETLRDSCKLAPMSTHNWYDFIKHTLNIHGNTLAPRCVCIARKLAPTSG